LINVFVTTSHSLLFYLIVHSIVTLYRNMVAAQMDPHMLNIAPTILK